MVGLKRSECGDCDGRTQISLDEVFQGVPDAEKARIPDPLGGPLATRFRLVTFA